MIAVCEDWRKIRSEGSLTFLQPVPPPMKAKEPIQGSFVFRGPGHGNGPGADDLLDADRLQQIDERLDLGGRTRDFDGIASGTDIDDLARKISITRRTSARVWASALILISTISRSTYSFSLMSVTLMTSISLCSCLVICSMMELSPRVTRVRQEIPGSRVSATQRLSILNPLPLNRPVTVRALPAYFEEERIRCVSLLSCRRDGLWKSCRLS